jgi:hypothetical protein
MHFNPPTKSLRKALGKTRIMETSQFGRKIIIGGVAA